MRRYNGRVLEHEGVMKKSLGLIGVGAFGRFAVPHLAPHFDLVLFDAFNDLSAYAKGVGAKVGTLEDIARCDVVVLGMPVQALAETAEKIAPYIRPGALVLDVCSVKEEPARIMAEILPDNIDIVGTHPLFGPQSGAKGLDGLKISLVQVRGGRIDCVEAFLKSLGLHTIVTDAETHDRQMAWVQGITHLMSKILVEMGIPELEQTTVTFDLMRSMVETVRYDSDQLFRAIENRNRFVGDTKHRFFDAARVIEDRLKTHGDGRSDNKNQEAGQ